MYNTIKSITQPTRVCRLYKTRRLNRRIFSTRERLPSLRLTNDRLKIGFLSCSPRCRGCIFECAVSSVSTRRRAVSHVSTESVVSTKKPKRCSPSFVQQTVDGQMPTGTISRSKTTTITKILARY